MADPTYTEGLRTRGISSDDLADAAITSIITESLWEYSRYRPIIADLTFDTVADQQVYTWTAMGDANGITALLVIWNPYETGDEWDLARTLATLGVPQEAGYWHMPSQDMIEQIKAAAWAATYGGSGFQQDIEGGDVYLTPTPDVAGDSVYVLYTKRHTANTTVRASDRDIYLDLLESMCADRIANDLSKSTVMAGMDVQTPEYRVSGASKQILYWRDRAKMKKAEFISKCQAGYAAVARS